MPIDIEGWVEYSPHGNKDEREAEHSWISWMDIRSMINFNDEVNWILFGNPRDFNNTKCKPVATSRGFPNNPGQYLQIDMNWIKEHEEKYGKGELFGFTYIYFSEIDKIDWQKEYQLSINESEWYKLFELIKNFKELKQIDSEQIRLTAWYNW